MKQLIYITVFLVLGTSVSAQQKSEKKILDQATLRCYYLFSKKNEGALKPFRSDTMVLDIGSQFSKFYDPARLGRDSILSAKMKEINAGNVKSIRVYKADASKDLSGMPGTAASNTAEGESYQIIKNRKTQKIRVLDYGSPVGDQFVYEDDPGNWLWKMSNEMDTISGYACQKASLRFRGRDYTAWFSADIPMSDGPWKFSGLPGLILKVEDSQALFSFELIGLKPLENPLPIVADESRSIKCSRAEFEQQKQKQGNGMQINANNGDVIIAENPVNYDYIPMEKE